MRSSLLIPRWTLNPMTSILITDTEWHKRREDYEEKENWRRRDAATAKDVMEPPAVRGGQEWCSLERLERKRLCRHLNFSLLASGTVKEIPVVLNHSICGNSFSSPRNLNKWLHASFLILIDQQGESMIFSLYRQRNCNLNLSLPESESLSSPSWYNVIANVFQFQCVLLSFWLVSRSLLAPLRLTH